MALPTIKVEVAFGSTWKTASPTWTDITAYVLDDDGVRWDRGRGRDSDSIQAGTASLTVRNRDDRFTPGYTAGPYGANVIPLVPIRITAVWSSVTYNLWRGFVREWRPDWTNPGDPRVALDCVDALRVFGQTTIRSQYFDQVLALAPTYYWSLQDEIRAINLVEDLSGNGNRGSYTPWTGTGRPGEGSGIRGGSLSSYDLGSNDPPDTVAVATTTTASQINTTADFTVALWWHGDGQDMTGGAGNVRKFFEQYGSANNFITLSFNSSTDKIDFTTYVNPTTRAVTSTNTVSNNYPHFIVATRTAGTLRLYVDGVLEGTTAGAALSLLAAQCYWGRNTPSTTQNMRGRISDLVCDVNSAWTGTQIADLYKSGHGYLRDPPSTRVGRVLDAIGWPAATRDLDTADDDIFHAPSLNPWPEDRNALSLIQDCVTVHDGDAYVDGAGNVCFRDWYSRAATFRSALAGLFPSGYWPLNETSGTTCNDRHSEVLGPVVDDNLMVLYEPAVWTTCNGTYQNTPTLDAGTLLGTPEPTAHDSAVTFVASNSEHVTIADAAQLEGNTAFCVGGWVNTATFGAERPIIAKSDAAASDWWLVIDSTGKLQCGYVNSGGTTRTVTTATGMTAGQSYFVMGWWSQGLEEIHACFIGMDGTVVHTSTSTPASETVRNTTKQVWIARRHGNYMNGTLSHVFITHLAWEPLQKAWGLWRSGQADANMLFWKDAYGAARWAFEEQQIRNTVRVEFEPESLTEDLNMLPYAELSDPTSIADYGERRDNRSGVPMNWTLFPGGVLARRLLARQSRPKLRIVDVTLNGALDPAVLWPVLLPLDVNAKPVVAYQSLASNVHITWGFVDRVEHRMNRSGWETSVQLSAY